MQSEDDATSGDEISKAASQYARLLEAKQKWYDPAVGPLPDWVPAPIRTRYVNVWGSLAQPYTTKPKPYSYQQVRALIERFRHLDEGDVEWDWIGAEPLKLFEEIAFLANVEYALSLGEVAGLMELAGRDARRGRKVLQASKQAHVEVYGTQEEKIARWRGYLATVAEIHRNNPHLSKSRVFELAADRCGVCKKTIERQYTRNQRESFTEDPFL